MIRIVDRLIERIAPKATASACGGAYFCNAAGHPGKWFLYCCDMAHGCQWLYIGPC